MSTELRSIYESAGALDRYFDDEIPVDLYRGCRKYESADLLQPTLIGWNTTTGPRNPDILVEDSNRSSPQYNQARTSLQTEGKDRPLTEPTIPKQRRKLISPAFTILFCLWAIAQLVLFTLGAEARSEAWQDLVLSPVLFGLMGITRYPNPLSTDDFPCPTESRARVCLQLVVIAAIILLTGVQYLTSHGIPVWSALANIFSRIGKNSPAGQLGATNFGQYALIPGALVLLLGASLGQMGLGRPGPSSLRIAAVWLLLPVAALGYAVYFVTRMHKSAWYILSIFIHNLFQNGISEEFLWRGLLLTRMRKFIGNDWANLLQAVLFGAWHFHYDYRSTHGHLVYAICAMFASQVVFGYVMGWLFLKMRNLTVPALFHAAFDTIGAIYS